MLQRLIEIPLLNQIFAVVLATIIPFIIHALLQSLVNEFIANNTTDKTDFDVAMPPYSFRITAVAALTAIMPTIGLLILFSLIYEKVPGENAFMKGFTFGLLILIIKGELFRKPIMNTLIGNPFWISLLQQLDIWIPNIVLCVILSLFISSANL
jgi:hypothetical protein